MLISIYVYSMYVHTHTSKYITNAAATICLSTVVVHHNRRYFLTCDDQGDNVDEIPKCVFDMCSTPP